MKINAKITLLFNEDGLHIEVEDDKAVIRFLDIHMTPEQTCKVLSRHANVEVESCEVNGLDHVGMKREQKEWIFQMPPGIDFMNRKETATFIAINQCPEGWTPSTYFGSQASFFHKDGAMFARTHIYRWVLKEEKIGAKS